MLRLSQMKKYLESSLDNVLVTVLYGMVEHIN